MTFAADVHLLDLQTATRAIWRSDEYLDEETGLYNDYVWREGNFSCDCNRGNFFAAALDKEWPESRCDDGINRRYMVEKIVRVSDGEVLYREVLVNGTIRLPDELTSDTIILLNNL